MGKGGSGSRGGPSRNPWPPSVLRVTEWVTIAEEETIGIAVSGEESPSSSSVESKLPYNRAKNFLGEDGRCPLALFFEMASVLESVSLIILIR